MPPCQVWKYFSCQCNGVAALLVLACRVGWLVRSWASHQKSSRKLWVVVPSYSQWCMLHWRKASCKVLKRPWLPSKASTMLQSPPSSWCQFLIERFVCGQWHGVESRRSQSCAAWCGGSISISIVVSRHQPRPVFCVDHCPSPVARNISSWCMG